MITRTKHKVILDDELSEYLDLKILVMEARATGRERERFSYLAGRVEDREEQITVKGKQF